MTDEAISCDLYMVKPQEMSGKTLV